MESGQLEENGRIVSVREMGCEDVNWFIIGWLDKHPGSLHTVHAYYKESLLLQVIMKLRTNQETVFIYALCLIVLEIWVIRYNFDFAKMMSFMLITPCLMECQGTGGPG